MIVVLFHSLASPEDGIISMSEEELYQQCKHTYTGGNFTEASQHIEKFLALYPESSYVAEVLSMQAFLQSDINTSVEMYQAIIKKYPGSKWAAKSYFQLGQCYYLRGKYDEALDNYGKIIIFYPEDETYWSARYWKCKSLIAKGEYEKAIAALRSLENSSFAKVSKDMILLSLGNCYLGMKDYENAAASYQALIESILDLQRLPSVYLLLAKSLQNLGKVEEARVFYKKVMEDYRQSIEAQQAQEYFNSLSLTKPKSVETEQHKTPVKTESYFSIQIGAFSSKRNADNLANRFKKKGYSVNIIRPSPGKSRFHMVRVGKFKSRSAALEMARKLKKIEKVPTDVVWQSATSE